MVDDIGENIGALVGDGGRGSCGNTCGGSNSLLICSMVRPESVGVGYSGDGVVDTNAFEYDVGVC